MLVSIQKSTGIILRETSRPSVLLIGRFRNCSIHHPLNLLLTNVKDKDKTEGQTGSSIQDQMLRLPGYLHW